MKYVFFGTPRFAAIILDRLIRADMPPVALVCNPDRPVGRKKIITPPPTKQLVVDEKLSVQIFQPEKLDTSFIEALRALKPDFFVVAAYAKIIPQTVLDIPRLGTLGTHPSLLPKYRGASPIQSVLLAGEEQTGTTIYAMDEKMDHGGIYAQKSMTIAADETYLSLQEKLAQLSAETLIETIPIFYSGAIQPRKQDEATATFTKKFTTEDGFIDENDLRAAQNGNDTENARAILRKINALNPEPGVWTTLNSKRIKLLEAKIEHESLKLISIQEEGQKVKRL
jgi:methionyl-tRNA formyltransferase